MDLDRKYEEFKGGPFISYRDRLHVTMNSRGVIFLNANLHRRWGRPEGVRLYFNREDDKLALVPTMPRGGAAFPLRENKGPKGSRGGGFLIQASPFCKHFGIRLDGTRKFINPELCEDGKLLLDLSNTVNVTLPRKRTKKMRP